MNYRHIYHAGNFADVFKHWILTLILQKLLEKPTPFFVLDTHSGIGIYDLQNENALKTLEFETGIHKLLNKKLTPEFKAFMNIVASLNNNDATVRYPGSPYICQDFLRAGDRLVLSELHKEEYATLQENFGSDKQIKVLLENGYTAVKAFLPPPERRGLILIDPPFEQPDEFDKIVTALEDGIKRFATGIYAVWYPIKDRKLVKRFYTQVDKLEIQKKLTVELHANQPVSNQLSSCGMMIINPPWQLEEKLRTNLGKLLEYLEFTNGSFVVES